MDLSYIAGFFDGEGSLGVYGKIQRPKISISQTDDKILEEIRDFIGVGQVYKTGRRKGKSHWKDSWVYIVNKREDCLVFIDKIQPYLRLQRKIDSCIEMRSIIKNWLDSNLTYGSKREETKKKVFLLNSKGLSCREIQDRVGISRSTVSRMLRE